MSEQIPPVATRHIDRRRFLHAAAVAGAAPLIATRPTPGGSALPLPDALSPVPPQAVPAAAATGADVGSLFPFIRKQAVAKDFPLSFLNPRFRTVAEWKPTARGTFLDLLHYAPPPVSPAAETVERVDCGDYVREKVWFNTTPDVRVPAYVLVPKQGPKPAPAIVALHDHGGFYLWGKEKLVAIDGEHPVFTEFRERYYGGRSIAIEMVRRGYVVVVIDMFYWGERRMLLDDDPADWRERPATHVARAHPGVQRPRRPERATGRAARSTPPASPGPA